MKRILNKLEGIFLSRKFFTLILCAALLVYGYLPASAFMAIAGAYMGILGILDWRTLGGPRSTSSPSVAEEQPTVS
jgi:hypothetical protein